jgi:hypothetical protein
MRVEASYVLQGNPPAHEPPYRENSVNITEFD